MNSTYSGNKGDREKTEKNVIEWDGNEWKYWLGMKTTYTSFESRMKNVEEKKDDMAVTCEYNTNDPNFD